MALEPEGVSSPLKGELRVFWLSADTWLCSQTMKVEHPKIAAWHWGQKIGKLYRSLGSGTLCLILLPGTKR
jgi:hypothetical protein